MSQPPPPPNQPPQGGFGAPQDPSYGYPQQPPGQPPAQPGYGYPQAPGQPPQAPHTPPPAPAPPPPPGPPQTPPSGMPQTPPPGAGGYGYPPQQPQSVHAQPTQVGMPAAYPSGQQPQYASGQQPQYGYPPQGPYPPQNAYPGVAPGGGQGGGNKSKQRMMIIVSAVVAVALIVAGGIFFATKGDGGSDDQAKDPKDKKQSQESTSGTTGGKDVPAPETVDGKLLNKIDMPKVSDQIDTAGMWVTDDTFVKSDVYKIVGYPLDGGSPKWTIPLAGEICWSSAHLNEDGLTTILFQEAKPSKADKYPGCTEVGLFDLNNGKMLWQKHVGTGDEKQRFDEVTLGGGTVAAGGTSGGAAWSLDGKLLWKPQDGEDCSDDGYAGGGDKLVAVRRCGQYDNPQLQVQTLNPKNGKIKSSYKVSPGLDYVHILSTDPLIVGLDAGDSTGASVSDFLTIDDSGKEGKVVSKISTEGGKYIADCETTDVEGCRMAVVSKSADALFMGSKERTSSTSGTANEVIAFSLKTGKPIGKTDGVEGAALTPLGLDKDGYVTAYQEATYDAGGAVWRIDTKSYKKDKLLQNQLADREMESKFSPKYNEVIYANQRLYMSDQYATKPSGSYDKDDPLAAIFGAGG
ncbi:hypothetical protein [Streptomyces milbemycinicus]|uniref:hypothetical protein n=1 Tax=Streptomyces milbemycinicus TaxID=476552 RepID=UPI0033F33F78